MRNRDSARQDAERETYRLRQEAARAKQAEEAVSGLLGRYFPFAKSAWERTTGHRNARERLRHALSTLDGVVLGESSVGLPALLALKERVKHLFIVGRSGGGMD